MSDQGPVTVAVIRVVKAGCEQEFELALHDFVQRSLELPGQLGVHILRPTPGSNSREYGILRRFANEDAQNDFYQSPLFEEWKKTVAGLVEGEPRYERISGLETWFTLPGRSSIIPPPRWKMAAVVLLASYTASLAFGVTINHWLMEWPRLLSTLIINVLMVVLLTWVLMPLLTRLLKHWLYPGGTHK